MDIENRLDEALPKLCELIVKMDELRGIPIHDREDLSQGTILLVLRQKSLLRECQQMFKNGRFIAVPHRVKQVVYRLRHQQLAQSAPTHDMNLPDSALEQVDADTDIWLDAIDSAKNGMDEQLFDLVRRGYGKQELCNHLGISSRFLAQWFEQKRARLRIYSPLAE